jgi:hypothetical protein
LHFVFGTFYNRWNIRIVLLFTDQVRVLKNILWSLLC